MRRTRATEMAMAQRQPPSSLRTSSSSSDNNRPRNERSIKPSEGRSNRGSQSDPANKKKLGTRIAYLESQLGLAQEELKSLKTQIVSVDAVKTASKDQIQDKKSIRQEPVPIDDVQKETDVFEVPMEKVDPSPDQDELKPKSVSTESPPAIPDPENSLIVELASKNDEINLLKANQEEKEKQLEAFREENEILKGQVDEKSLKISLAQSKIDELNLRLEKAEIELQRSKISAVEMNEKLDCAEKAKEELEEEMKKLRVQTEQWRKAADAAASVLEINGRRVSERCGSMDYKHYGNGFGPIGGYAGYVGSPGLIDDDDDYGSGKRKGSGIRMFGDLWKKKG